MNKDERQQFSFLYSALADKNEFQSHDDFFSWFHNFEKSNRFIVDEVPFDELDQWYFEKETKNLKHSSGKFFSIEGISVHTNFGNKQKWEQPIIVQPEIGILGIITKVFNGVRYFLMQAKMEPGNVNIIQLSPTVQATKSNFTKVHKGNLPKYLEYFIDREKAKVLIDQLQPEQGGRFLRKRNRNMVIEVVENINIEDGFIWVTLSEIKKFLQVDNLVNMDARSVLATIPFVNEEHPFLFNEVYNNRLKEELCNGLSQFGCSLIISSLSTEKAYKSFREVISWITEMKTNYELHVTRIPLDSLPQWNFSDYDISHESKRFFSVIGVKVQAGTREVLQWTQPLLKETTLGLIGYIIKEINGTLHFLIQAKVEPGNFDVVELAPTVSCSNYEYVLENPNKPKYIEYFVDSNKSKKIYSNIQSEEGGRFFHFQNKNMIVLVDEEIELQSNYMWLTLGQMNRLMRFGYLNIESRSIISALSLI